MGPGPEDVAAALGGLDREAMLALLDRHGRALDRLGVSPEAAVFVDDQARFCAGSVAVGIRTAQIVRGETEHEVVELTLGQTKVLDMALGVSGLSESVQVTSEQPLIDVLAKMERTGIAADSEHFAAMSAMHSSVH